MNHSDPTTLALAALGEPVPETDRAHIAACPVCRAELDRLQAAARLGRDVHPDDEPTPPPPGLWQRINDELAGEPGPPAAGDGRSEASTSLGGDRGSARHGEDDFAPRATGATHLPGSAPTPSNGATAPRERWFRLRTSLALAASAALIGAAVGIGGTLWAARDDESPPMQVTAATRLEPLPAHRAVGDAVLDTGGETGRRLVVRVSGLAPQPGFYEVWLLDRDAQKMIAVGMLPAHGEATFDLPPTLDLAGYPVVDVSLQQYNGSPQHSGDSVVRGTLPSS
ncbi:anti-sigma factor [Embleya sp. NPDC008237]|uniref:anti-sigma factor n=1 Tax=Embleya sp. NPDC008237 TaxID=3363978 RepID=UPI0036E973D8